MATYVEIFLRPLHSQSIESVVSEVSSTVGAELVRDSKYDGISYVGMCDGVTVELFMDHGFDDDNDMPFSGHPYMLRFRTLTMNVEEAQSCMEQSYEKLRQTGNYSMFSTYDVQHLLRSNVVNT
jgi:hypothetical protein